MTRKLTQSEWADLSGWLDGELSHERAEEVRDLLESDEAWANAAAELRALDEVLSAETAPAPPEDLSRRVMQFVREHALGEDDHAELSAWMDGELDDAAAARVAARVASTPAWRRAYAELSAVDEALDDWTVPAPPKDLTGRVFAQTTRRPMRLLKLALTPARLAAAAAVVIALGAYLMFALSNDPPIIDDNNVAGNNTAETRDKKTDDARPAQDLVQKELANYDEAEQFAIMHRDLVENYEVIRNFEMLAEIERLEMEQGS
ncbi:MAG: anti-sigma factor family protein [Phycisphaerae bacterium]